MKNQEIVNFIMTEINKYKSDAITKEAFYDVIEGLVSTTHLEYSGNETLKYVLEHLIPDACTFYIDEPGEWQEKENGFRRAILECEELISNIKL